MTVNSIKALNNKAGLKQELNPNSSFTLAKKYGINVSNIRIISDFEHNLSDSDKELIIEKLLEAHEIALINIKAGNITGRGFATNVMTNDGYWSTGTNFNNTRNEISSICGERSAILSSYNEALMRFSKKINTKFDFKIKYICMAQSDDLSMIKDSAIPCEDCLAWFNTTRYFDDNTMIFSFEKIKNNALGIRISKLTEYLPYKNYPLSNLYNENKNIKYSKQALISLSKYNVSEENILNMNRINYQAYKNNQSINISNQNIVCSIIANDKIYTSAKIDWTKRWFMEPLEYSCCKAIENEKSSCKISAIAYFGDDYAINQETNERFYDGGISIKSLGRVRQKYASGDTLLILNLHDIIFVLTLSEYLPKKFIQGYKII